MNNIVDAFERKKVIIYDKRKNKKVYEINNLYPQHYYPLTVIDYFNAIKEYIKSKEKSFPIMSVTVKDYPICDFNCKDCLVKESRNWALKNIDKLTFDLECYKGVLKQISNYSKEKGFDSVRIEFCGEGNPDLYRYRKEIIEYANKECNMKIVYVSTGSKLSEEDKINLVKNASFIRISFPGIDKVTYKEYSRQKSKKQFSYNDAINLLNDLIKLRKKYKRENELLIGVRASIRNEFSGKYIEFSKQMDNIGIDCIQFVKLIFYNIPISGKKRLNDDLIKELKNISNSKEYKNIKQVQIPKDLDIVCRNRQIKNEFNICFSSLFNPVLYGDHLIVCTHWDKIMDTKYHYGALYGKEKEVFEMLNTNKIKMIQEDIKGDCKECCSIYDNTIFNEVYKIMSNYEDINSLEFKYEK